MADSKQEKTKFLQIRIDEKLLNEFNEITNEYSVNKSALIRIWIERYIAQHRKVE